MIQKTSQRQLNALAGPTRAGLDGPSEWGQWIHDRYYSLEVIQQPLRARMCGFGDKDRRPLAPAAVARMVVRRQDSSVLEAEDIDIDFFLVTVDLWSADGRQEMNLVLHPASPDRYYSPRYIKPRKRVTPRPNPTPPPAEHPPGARPPDFAPPTAAPTPVPATYPYPFPAHEPFAGTAEPWSYSTPVHAPTLPSIHSIGRASPVPLAFHDVSPVAFPPPDAADPVSSFRGWGDAAASLFDTHGVEPVLRDTGPSRWQNDPLMLPSLAGADAWSSPVSVPPHTQHAYQAFGQPLQQEERPPTPDEREREGQYTIPLPPRHSYTRTLVGPLSANAQRLQDEHRKPGVFFLFQDLSIRTEGTFRLRMRLMNVGVPPAPNGLSNSVHTSVSPVLAQTFTEPFTVYSAKRFPGVPATTALSIAFGNQGQKLPLRNRHGMGKRPRLDPQPVSSDEESS